MHGRISDGETSARPDSSTDTGSVQVDVDSAVSATGVGSRIYRSRAASRRTSSSVNAAKTKGWASRKAVKILERQTERGQAFFVHEDLGVLRLVVWNQLGARIELRVE